LDVIDEFKDTKPIFGICLGHHEGQVRTKTLWSRDYHGQKI